MESLIEIAKLVAFVGMVFGIGAFVFAPLVRARAERRWEQSEEGKAAMAQFDRGAKK